jgi:hypothetical protein
MELLERQFKFTALLAIQINWINSQEGYRCIVGEVDRPQVLQDIYLEQKKTKVKISTHTYDIAADIKIYKLVNEKWIYLESSEDYKFAGEHWESLDPGCIWGGRFGDDPNTPQVEGWDGNHFQYTTLKGGNR